MMACLRKRKEMTTAHDHQVLWFLEALPLFGAYTTPRQVELNPDSCLLHYEHEVGTIDLLTLTEI